MSYNNFKNGVVAGFEGWRVATESELITLVNGFLNVNVNVTISTPLSVDSIASWKSTFGVTGTGWISAGLYEKDNGFVDVVGLHINDNVYSTGYYHSAHDSLEWQVM
jgi:hypothetical protein